MPVGLLLVGIASTAFAAEESKISDTVRDRPRPALDAQGVRLGTFTLFPKLGLGLMFDSNIYATDVIEVDDVIWFIQPELILESDWSRNELEIGFDLVAARYTDFDTEDYKDWRIWADTTLDVGRGEVTAVARYADLHVPRTSPDNRDGIEPTLFSSAELSVGYGLPFGRFTGEVGVRQRQLTFDDTITLTGPVSNADQDRGRTDVRVRVGHETLPGFLPFLQLNLTEVRYDQQFDDNGYERSSDGFDLVAGTDIDLTGRTFGEVYAGYVSRDYEDPRYSSIDGPIFGGQITWNVTGLTTMIFSADRWIQGTTIVGASGILNTGFGLNVAHELRRNVILGLDIAFDNQNFEGIDRDDDIFRTGLNATYLMNRYLRLLASYSYQARNTSPADSGGFEYRIQTVFVGVEAQF